MNNPLTQELARRAGSEPATVTQATAVEQARAVAEVQAAVVVAQQRPRNLDRAQAEMRDACGRLAVAERAFYTVPNRGNGMSVHLARELARIWGNLTYGVRELRRDDLEGLSEIEVFAWDWQANVRPSRTVQVPHARMKGRNRQRLDDLTDIVNNNNSVGARQLRECIKALLPDWFVAEAEQICRATLARGDGQPLDERVAKMLGLFQKLGITQTQVETRTGKRRSQWTPEDLGRLVIDYQSITSDGIDPATIFPSDTLNALEAQAASATPPAEPVDQSWPAVAQPGNGPS